MDLWFQYAMTLAEIVYDAKLHEYEEACAMALAVEVDHQLIARHVTSVEGQQLVEVKVATNFLDRMQLRKPIRAMKTRDFIDAIECEKESAYCGLEAGYRLLPEDLEVVQACAEQNGWASRATTPLPSNRSSVGDDSSGQGGGGSEDQPREARERAALLYGEMTSVGTRQLYHYFRDAIESALPSRATRGVVQVGMDVGCGTGKVLYEWARLAAAESTCAPVATATLDKKRKKYNNFVPYLSMARSPQSLMSSCASSYNLGHSAKMPSALQQLMQQDEAFPTMPHPSMDLPRLRGWLGVGVEVAPTRMYVARQALAPYYLDLQRQEMLLVAGRRSGTGQRFDPAPPRAVACPHQDPNKRQPTACVLLHEGDMLTPGLLTNSTLRRFPAMRLSGDTPTTPTSAKDNYYRIARTENGAVLTGVEEIHLSVFCCGLALDETVVRLLCQQMEGLLHRNEPRGSDSDEEEEEAVASSSAGNMNSNREPHRRHREHPSLPHESQPSTFTFLQQNQSPTCFSHSLTGGRTTALQPTPVASRHWRSITFVLLLSPDFEERHQLQDLPLFRCCRRVDLAHDASFQQQDAQQPPSRSNSAAAIGGAASEDGTHPLLVGMPPALRTLGDNADLLPAAAESSTGGLGSLERNPSARFRHQHSASTGSTGFPIPGCGSSSSMNNNHTTTNTTTTTSALDKQAHRLCENENSRRWLDAAEVRSTPSWLTAAGLEDSTLQRIHVSTTWMEEAPAYLLHFRFEVREEELDASIVSQAPI